MKNLKMLTIADIRALEPCYDPVNYISREWTGTILDVLKMARVPAQDRLWVVTRFINQKTQRLFTVFCARQIIKTLGECTEAVEAIDVAEKYAKGEARKYKLQAAKKRVRAVITTQSENGILACNIACWCAQDYVSAYTHVLIARAPGVSDDDTFWQEQIDELLRMIGESDTAPPAVATGI